MLFAKRPLIAPLAFTFEAFALALALLLFLAPNAAAAGPAEVEKLDKLERLEKARKLFAVGVQLYQSGNWQGAQQVFRDANTVHHAPAIVYNIGLVEEKLGHAQAAVDAYESYIAEVGGAGEFSAAAASAIAQIKSRSTRLRLETKPGGVRLFVDGSALGELSPTNLLVTAGHHVIVAQGDGWRAEQDVEVRGAGDVVPVLLEAANVPPPAPAPEPALSSPPAFAPPSPREDVKPAVVIAQPQGLVWGASFAIVPAYLLGIRTAPADNAKDALTIVAGPVLEIGYALSDRFLFLARGLLGIGPDGKPSYAYALGPGLSYRVGSSVWLGASFIGGQLETRARSARYGTDQVFGTMLEAGVVVLKKPDGEWIVSAQPSVLVTEMRQDNTTFFLPLSFGYRAY